MLNYGRPDAALQKLLGYIPLSIAAEYAASMRTLAATVERALIEDVVQLLREESLSWVPSFFMPADYLRFAAGHAVKWVQLPLGY